MSDDVFAKANRQRVIEDRLRAEKSASDQLKADVKARIAAREKAATEAAKPPPRYKPNFSMLGL